jgi:hypothetical protein
VMERIKIVRLDPEDGEKRGDLESSL